MIDAIIEIGVNLFQAFTFIGFFLMFFNKQKKTKKDYIYFVAFSLILFAVFTYFSFHPLYLNFMDEIIYILIEEAYTLIILKGNIFARIIMPLVEYMINTVISFGFAYTICHSTNENLESLMIESSIYRYLCMVLISLTNAVVLFIIVRFNRTEFKLKKWTDIVSFLVIPIISIMIVYSCLYVSALTRFQLDVQGFLLFICLSMIAVAIVTWFMMVRISKNNDIQTKLLLTEQREKLYEKDILHTNEQIENMSKIKHDIKNNTLCIGRLISDGKYKEAEEFCNSLSENLETIYTPIATNIPLLNAVINVELEKAFSNDIDFQVNINEQAVSGFKNTDIVSILGNMCDNAIDYLKHQPKNMREMSLDISYKKSYIIITCKNRISESILEKNPNLITTKNDKEHGKGINIISDCVKRYGGELKYCENDNFLYVSAIIHSVN